MNNPFLIGKRVYLRSLTIEDIDNKYYRWFNDQETTVHMVHGRLPETREASIEFYNNLRKRNDIIHFAIIDKTSDKHIGCCSLSQIDWISRSAELARIIGEKEFRGKGIGTEVGEILLNYGFINLNLNRIWLGNIITNKSAINSVDKLGFHADGILRSAVYKNGFYCDVKISSVLREEYLSKS